MRFERAALAAMLALLLATACAPRDPAAGLRRVTIATGPTGTQYHQIGTSLSTVIERELDKASTARPHTGSSLYIPQMHRGELPFGLNNSTDTAAAYRGQLVYAEPLKNLRAVMLVSRSPMQYFVRGDSGITSMADLRGKPVVTSFRANVPFDIINAAALATAGLTLDDVDPVTVAGVPDAIRALVEGRVVAASTLLGIPAFREANATVPGGLRILPLGANEAALTSMPGFDAFEVQPGPANPGIDVPTRVARMDIYLNSSVNVSADDVYEVLTAIHGNWAELQKSLPAFRSVAAGEIAPVNIGHPWHEGAVRYFREHGLWTEAHEQRQQALLRGEP
ncbi:MAG: TAXI family TRAP transporter solute-binding subunit [Pseudomonadota bacterium]|nr:TAXI family TRAP transporter solute-binding subunit [Pseudomonadota bacterium]